MNDIIVCHNDGSNEHPKLVIFSLVIPFRHFISQIALEETDRLVVVAGAEITNVRCF